MFIWMCGQINFKGLSNNARVYDCEFSNNIEHLTCFVSVSSEYLSCIIMSALCSAYGADCIIFVIARLLMNLQ